MLSKTRKKHQDQETNTNIQLYYQFNQRRVYYDSTEENTMCSFFLRADGDGAREEHTDMSVLSVESAVK